MDTKALVVGQDVHAVSGVYSIKGKVVKVTQSGVEVQTGVMQTNGAWNVHELMHFDENGKGLASEGTYECGPYHIETLD